MSAEDEAVTDNALPAILVHLLRGVIYKERHSRLWNDLMNLQAAVRDYFRPIGLELYLHEAEGYAFLKQQKREEIQDDPNPVPRLMPRRSLSFPVSLLLVLLRKRIAETDATSGETRVVLNREQISDMMLLFMPEQKNEARLNDQIQTAVNRAIEYGFLRRLKHDEGEMLEINRILKAFVDAQWLDNFHEHLNTYTEYAEESAN